MGWVFFRADSLGHATAFLKAMAGLGMGSGLAYHTGLYVDAQLTTAVVAGVIGSAPLLPLLGRLRERMALPGGSARLVWSTAELGILSLLLVASAMHLASGTYNPFIYFRF